MPAFQILLKQQEGNLAEFYKAAAKLGDLPKDQRSKALTALLQDYP